jgi:hypothetical protein
MAAPTEWYLKTKAEAELFEIDLQRIVDALNKLLVNRETDPIEKALQLAFPGTVGAEKPGKVSLEDVTIMVKETTGRILADLRARNLLPIASEVVVLGRDIATAVAQSLLSDSAASTLPSEIRNSFINVVRRVEQEARAFPGYLTYGKQMAAFIQSGVATGRIDQDLANAMLNKGGSGDKELDKLAAQGLAQMDENLSEFKGRAIARVQDSGGFDPFKPDPGDLLGLGINILQAETTKDLLEGNTILPPIGMSTEELRAEAQRTNEINTFMQEDLESAVKDQLRSQRINPDALAYDDADMGKAIEKMVGRLVSRAEDMQAQIREEFPSITEAELAQQIHDFIEGEAAGGTNSTFMRDVNAHIQSEQFKNDAKRTGSTAAANDFLFKHGVRKDDILEEDFFKLRQIVKEDGRDVLEQIAFALPAMQHRKQNQDFIEGGEDSVRKALQEIGIGNVDDPELQAFLDKNIVPFIMARTQAAAEGNLTGFDSNIFLSQLFGTTSMQEEIFSEEDFLNRTLGGTSFTARGTEAVIEPSISQGPFGPTFASTPLGRIASASRRDQKRAGVRPAGIPESIPLTLTTEELKAQFDPTRPPGTTLSPETHAALIAAGIPIPEFASTPVTTAPELKFPDDPALRRAIKELAGDDIDFQKFLLKKDSGIDELRAGFPERSWERERSELDKLAAQTQKFIEGGLPTSGTQAFARTKKRQIQERARDFSRFLEDPLVAKELREDFETTPEFATVQQRKRREEEQFIEQQVAEQQRNEATQRRNEAIVADEAFQRRLRTGRGRSRRV